jgi:uncharacterized membrane protein YfbV (UPF0208 family)
MPVTWIFRGSVLTLSVRGVVTNRDIEAAFAEALAAAPILSGLRLLWDARESQTPLSAEDVEWRCQLVSSLGERGVLTRAVLLLRPDQEHRLKLLRQELWKELLPVEGTILVDEADALAWLDR